MVAVQRVEDADIVPFGGGRAHKSSAVAVGLQLLCEALAGPDRAAVMLIAWPGRWSAVVSGVAVDQRPAADPEQCGGVGGGNAELDPRIGYQKPSSIS